MKQSNYVHFYVHDEYEHHGGNRPENTTIGNKISPFLPNCKYSDRMLYIIENVKYEPSDLDKDLPIIPKVYLKPIGLLPAIKKAPKVQKLDSVAESYRNMSYE